MAKLIKWPQGLLELLRLRNEGVGPSEFSETLVPVLVANDHYGADLQFTSSDPQGAGSMPRAITGVVGAGNRAPGPIRLLGLSCQFTLGANVGTRLILRLSIRAPGAGTTIPDNYVAAQMFTAGLVAGEVYTLVWQSPTPLVLLPGSGIRCEARGDQTGNDHSIVLRTLQQVLNTG